MRLPEKPLPWGYSFPGISFFREMIPGTDGSPAAALEGPFRCIGKGCLFFLYQVFQEADAFPDGFLNVSF